MGFAFIIIIRILFITCMVFIIGYVFGGFSKKKSLTTITKIATILAIVLFIAANVMLMRMAFMHHGQWQRCGYQHEMVSDSSIDKH
ncbi:hypothetical protein CLV51_106224 [Chitinophaga niastensis]|uniref:Uncharacterized protein n=1 Tax=Chitinophaga niastensis TaxID=536980 RepID=A0A2P8HDQ9_CHINA|nr:hypothetical protein [Chitinophaga niastensis]PSL44358.1 hypothetical protein CLV51_106224 [Chitinophaga niastensis]